MTDKRITTTQLKKIISVVRNNRYRPKATNGQPGGLIELPKKTTSLIVGDLHSCAVNLKSILEHNGNEARIRKGGTVLVLIGDTVHNDQTGQLREMGSSLKTLDYVFQLFLTLGDKLIYLRGNHDSFDERLMKSGIKQGMELKNYILSERGSAYTDLVERFFESLPVFIIGAGYVVTHAGPVREGTDRDQLIEIYSDRDKYLQLQWNRINEFRGTPSSKEYGEYDIHKTLDKLRLPPETHFIVGHNPLWNTGNDTGVWLDVLGIKNHHILYSGAGTRAPYMLVQGGKLQVEFAIAKKSEAMYV